MPTSAYAPRLKLSRYLTVSEPLADDSGVSSQVILFGSRQAHTVVVDKYEWAVLCSGEYHRLSAMRRAQLIDCEILVPDEQDELQAVLEGNRRDLADNDVCYTVIQPSAYCQLGCHYCGQEHLPFSLNEHKADLLIRHMRYKLEQGSFAHVAIGWFGGEPLLGLPAMRRLTPSLVRLAEEFSCSYSAKIVTNGLRFTSDVATELSERLRVGYAEITLDGLANQHDSRRPWKNGRGSFDRIFANVVTAARRDDLKLRVGIRCNVDRFNFQDVIPLMDRLVEADVQQRIAKFYVAPIHAWGNDADSRSLSPEEFGRWEINWYAALARRGFPLSILPERTKTVCMAVQPAAEVIDASGKIFHCTEVSQVPAYEHLNAPYGNIHAVGDLAVEPKTHQSDQMREFNDVIARREVPCHTCEILPVCGGSCPKLWLEGKPACPPMKSNLPQRLQLVHLLETHGALARSSPSRDDGLC